MLIQAVPETAAAVGTLTADILLVDHDEAVRLTMGAVLEEDGHRASLESAIEALRGGAFSYLLKPCDLGDLRQAISAGLARRRLIESTRLAAQANQDRSARALAQRVARRAVRLQELTAQLSSAPNVRFHHRRRSRTALALIRRSRAPSGCGVMLCHGNPIYPRMDHFRLTCSTGSSVTGRRQITWRLGRSTSRTIHCCTSHVCALISPPPQIAQPEYSYSYVLRVNQTTVIDAGG